MVSFPLAKLGMLAVRQISKPIVKVIKQTAETNQTFRAYLVNPIAQTYHWIGVRSKMWMIGMSQPKYVPPLNKSMAIETGSNLIGEICLFTVCASLISLEFLRQSKNDQIKNNKQKEEKEKLIKEIEVLQDRVMAQTNEIYSLKAKLYQLHRVLN
ncbi:putative OPA3-like protein CG13603 [Drosophila grimshawi]|uniref:putative OPA3-like protein CG13603 n=1 Tax=Drosophila grimshawi TaxID=7222 RepID=UPI000C870A5B|nr:putative OPA3-like protein CG13603 [Drosophila grimshawi]